MQKHTSETHINETILGLSHLDNDNNKKLLFSYFGFETTKQIRKSVGIWSLAQIICQKKMFEEYESIPVIAWNILMPTKI